MPKKLTQEEYEARVFECVGDKYKVLSEYQGKTKPVKLFCKEHSIEFSTSAECFMRGSADIRGMCPQCKVEKKQFQHAESRVELKCAYCGETFIRAKSKLENSKSGLYFCCREHKDLAQRLGSGSQFDNLRPDHYGIITSASSEAYRNLAFRHYPHKCAVCGYNEEPRILQVHHKDSNRSNNDVSNLCILCPNCHAKITYHWYVLTDDFQLKPL